MYVSVMHVELLKGDLKKNNFSLLKNYASALVKGSVNVLAAKPDGLSSIPRTHTEGGPTPPTHTHRPSSRVYLDVRRHYQIL